MLGMFGWTGDHMVRDMVVHNKESLHLGIRTFMCNTGIHKIKHNNKTTNIISEYYSYWDHKYRLFTYFYWWIKGSTNRYNRVNSYDSQLQGRNEQKHMILFECIYCFTVCNVFRWEQVRSTKLLMCSDFVVALNRIETGTATNQQDLLFELLFTNIQSAWMHGNTCVDVQGLYVCKNILFRSQN